MSRALRVPYVPTPEPVVRRMLSLARLSPGETVYDLGAGDGRILLTALEEFQANAVGVELHPERARELERRLRPFDERAKIIREDLFKVSLSHADVVTLYLLRSVNKDLRPKLEAELKPGTRVISHDFPIPGWAPDWVEEMKHSGNRHFLYLYKIGEFGRDETLCKQNTTHALPAVAQPGRASESLSHLRAAETL